MGQLPSNLMIDKFLILMFLFAPLFYITKMAMPKAETILFVVSVAILFVLSTLEKPKREVALTPFIILLSVAVIQLFVYNFSPTSANCIANIFIGVVGISIIARYSNGLNKTMLNMIVLGGLINIVMIIIPNPIIENHLGQPGGLMGNAPRLGNYLALTLPFAFACSWLAGVLWLLTGIYINQFPMFLVGFVLAGIYFYKDIQVKSSFYFILPLIGLFIGFIVWQHVHIAQSISHRLLQWQPIIEQVFQHPILGLGVGTYQIFVNNFNEVAMSSFMEFIFNFGFVAGGFVLYIFAKDFIKDFKPSLIHVTIAGLAAMSVIEYPFEIPRLWPLIIAIGGFYLIEKTGDNNEPLSHHS